jgi:clan AA aspartic protease
VIGTVDESDRALLALHVRATPQHETSDVVCWIDTAFDGELVMPYSAIQPLELTQSAAIRATLADGSTVLLESFECLVEWLGAWRQVEVIANEGWIPLLGTGLLHGHRLTIDYRHKTLAVD